MGWRGYIDRPRKTVFFWSQKAACTTLFSFLAENIPERPEQKKYFHQHSQSYQPCLKAIRHEGFQSVIIARHPVKRAISAYFNKFCLYGDKPLLSRSDLEPFARDLHDFHFARRGIQTDDNLMSFEDFLDAVSALHASRPRENIPVNGHWETQVPPFLLRERFHYDTVVHVERLNTELAALADRLDMTFHPSAMNRTPTLQKQEAVYFGDRPAREISSLNFGYDNFISPETLARIREIYAVDFEMFNYAPTP